MQIRDENNSPVPNPLKQEEYLTKIDTKEESINVDRIKSVRKFHKKKGTYEDFEDITVVYLKPEFKERVTELRIAYKYEDFVRDVNDLKAGREIKGSA